MNFAHVARATCTKATAARAAAAASACGLFRGAGLGRVWQRSLTAGAVVRVDDVGAPAAAIKTNRGTLTAESAAPSARDCLLRLAQRPNTVYYALIEVKGMPYHITRTDLLMIDRLDVPLGAVVVLDKVREFGTREVTLRGSPFVSGVTISAVVVAHPETMIRFRPKVPGLHRHQAKRGSRQCLTYLRITDINYNPQAMLALLSAANSA